MKPFFILTALFFLLVSCSSCSSVKNYFTSTEYDCPTLHKYLYAAEVDTMLLEACYAEKFQGCHPEDESCLYGAMLKCSSDGMKTKVDDIESYLDQGCHRF